MERVLLCDGAQAALASAAGNPARRDRSIRQDGQYREHPYASPVAAYEGGCILLRMTDERPLFRSEIAERFRNLRRDAYLTQVMLADVAGLYQSTVSRIETCRHKIGPSTWRKFSLVESQFRRGAIDPHRDWCDWARFR